MTHSMTKGLEYALAQVLSHHTGQRIVQIHPRSALFVRRRARQYGFSHPVAFLRWITKDVNAQQELDALIDLTINGLTTFYREPQQLDAAQTLMDKWTSSRPMAIWSAGCSTGEEAYTLSMLARQTNTPCSILGTDINRRALARARHGRYGTWSLRRMDERLRHTHLRESLEGEWHVRERVRQPVAFEYHHLLYETPDAPNPQGWDMIMCRNVFIYFNKDALARALNHLINALAPDGCLILGTSEGDIGLTHGLVASLVGQGVVYRAGGEQNARPQAPRHQPPKVELDRVCLVTLEHAVALAADEDLYGAIDVCASLLRVEPLSQDVLHILGMLWRTVGERQRAMDTFQHVLFLDPMHWFAAYELAHLWAALGEQSRTRAMHRQMLSGVKSPNALALFTPELAHLTRRTALEQLTQCAALSLDALLELCTTR